MIILLFIRVYMDGYRKYIIIIFVYFYVLTYFARGRFYSLLGNILFREHIYRTPYTRYRVYTLHCVHIIQTKVLVNYIFYIFFYDGITLCRIYMNNNRRGSRGLPEEQRTFTRLHDGPISTININVLFFLPTILRFRENLHNIMYAHQQQRVTIVTTTIEYIIKYIMYKR